ncbi:MAG: SDR family NAD(P)-dependent oxidoreductase [Pseudomonadota bacterium]
MKSINNAVVLGASGGIGAAFVENLAARDRVEHVFALSRTAPTTTSSKTTSLITDYTAPETLAAAAAHIAQAGPLDLVIIATGILHGDEGFAPEKSLRDLDAEKLARAYLINTIGPALAAKHFLPLMRKDERSVFAALSARVGSISDNRMGGWYGYRAAKSALNQIIKTASIEHARRWPKGIVVGLHPGTVDTDLSKPFQRNVQDNKLFKPAFSAGKMLDVLSDLVPADTGKIFDWAGKEVPA